VVAAHGRRGDEDGYDGQQETGRCVRTHDFDIIIKCYFIFETSGLVKESQL